MFIFRIRRFSIFLLRAAVGFEMRFQSILGFAVMMICFFISFPMFSSETREKIKIIERVNFQKKMSVKNLTNVTDGRLKNYRTFSFNLSGKLIFCHISNDGSEPRVICH